MVSRDQHLRRQEVNNHRPERLDLWSGTWHFRIPYIPGVPAFLAKGAAQTLKSNPCVRTRVADVSWGLVLLDDPRVDIPAHDAQVGAHTAPRPPDSHAGRRRSLHHCVALRLCQPGRVQHRQ